MTQTFSEHLEDEVNKILAAGLVEWIKISPDELPDYLSAAKKAGVKLKGCEAGDRIQLYCERDKNMDEFWKYKEEA